MDKGRPEGKQMLNEPLMKLVGIYKVLGSVPSVKIGRYNVYHVGIAFVVVCSWLLSAAICLTAVRYWKHHMIDSIVYVGVAQAISFMSYKITVVVCRSAEIRDCLSKCTRTLDHGEGASVWDSWRNRSNLYTNLYAIACYGSLSLYLSVPMVFSGQFRTMKDTDGSSSNYHVNVFNVYALMSAETYNTHFFTMYLIEASCVCFFIIFCVIYDTLVMTLCLTLSCQFQTVNNAYEALGHSKRNTDGCNPSAANCISAANSIGFQIHSKTPEEHRKIHEDIKNRIKDHQTAIKNLEQFFSIYRQVVLLQIAASSCSIIVNVCSIMMGFLEGESRLDSEVVKNTFSCPVLTFQLFMNCYLIGSINTQKEFITIALYSSNWTEMDSKCKKLILFAIKMNNAHNLKLKFTQTRVINLEMFLRTMNLCYSILSVLLNYKKNQIQ